MLNTNLRLLPLIVIGFIVLVAIGLVVIIIVVATRASRNREVARLAGVDAVGGQAQALRGGPPRPVQAMERRLQELDDLRARGVITYEEYVAARQRAIDGQATG